VTSEGSTRRGVLRGGLSLLAGALGLGTAGVAVAGAAAPPAAERLRLHGTEVGTRVHGRAHGRPAEPHDGLTTHGRLLAGPAGREIGAFHATATAVRAHDGTRSTIEQHLFVLDDGTITGSGQAHAGAGVFAITGGTGRFAGARGTYTATVSAHGIGGDGTAHFDFNLSS
jgi:hypothetical protein